MNGGYAYDNRYLLDANFRADGSSVFGVSNKFTTTWAVGVGWNIHNESFVKNCAFIDFLKLRYSIGIRVTRILACTCRPICIAIRQVLIILSV